MRKLSKRMTAYKSKIKNELYNPLDAFEVITKNSKEIESVDISFVLGINGKKSDQVVKGVVEKLPAGLGKKVSVAVFTKSSSENGAEFSGFEDLFEKVKKEEIEADVYIATIDIMPELAKMGLGRILKGKMPNPKFGTVVEAKDVAKAVAAQKAGQLAFRSNASVINCSIGRASFSTNDLFENFNALLKSVANVRPMVIKPHSYFKKIFVSSTMGPGIQINLSEAIKDIKV